jgi:hypothetical protein
MNFQYILQSGMPLCFQFTWKHMPKTICSVVLRLCFMISDLIFWHVVQACGKISTKDDKEMAIYDFKVCYLSCREFTEPWLTRMCSARFLCSPYVANNSQAFDNGSHSGPHAQNNYKKWLFLIYFLLFSGSKVILFIYPWNSLQVNLHCFWF